MSRINVVIAHDYAQIGPIMVADARASQRGANAAAKAALLLALRTKRAGLAARATLRHDSRGYGERGSRIVQRLYVRVPRHLYLLAARYFGRDVAQRIVNNGAVAWLNRHRNAQLASQRHSIRTRTFLQGVGFIGAEGLGGTVKPWSSYQEGRAIRWNRGQGARWISEAGKILSDSGFAKLTWDIQKHLRDSGIAPSIDVDGGIGQQTIDAVANGVNRGDARSQEYAQYVKIPQELLGSGRVNTVRPPESSSGRRPAPPPKKKGDGTPPPPPVAVAKKSSAVGPLALLALLAAGGAYAYYS